MTTHVCRMQHPLLSIESCDTLLRIKVLVVMGRVQVLRDLHLVACLHACLLNAGSFQHCQEVFSEQSITYPV